MIDGLKLKFQEYIDAEYQSVMNTPSDIHEHIPILYDLAKDCVHITEFGVRYGISTRAFLKADVTLRSYDIELEDNTIKAFDMARAAGKDVEYIESDVLDIDIVETDLIMFDTWHTYAQLKKELAKHAHKSRKYIVFHDVMSYALKNESFYQLVNGKYIKVSDDKGTQGIFTAILEFLGQHPEWKPKIWRTNNNGLLVLEK